MGKTWIAFAHGLGLACGLIFSILWIVRFLETPALVRPSVRLATLADASKAIHLTGPLGKLLVETIYTEKPCHFIDVASVMKSEESCLFLRMNAAGVCEWMTANGFVEAAVKELVATDPHQDL